MIEVALGIVAAFIFGVWAGLAAGHAAGHQHGVEVGRAAALREIAEEIARRDRKIASMLVRVAQKVEDVAEGFPPPIVEGTEANNR